MATAKDFFERFFITLEKNDISYVILHSYQNFPEEIASDVDYLVKEKDIKIVHKIIMDVARDMEWGIAQYVHYGVNGYAFLVVNPENLKEFLHLDVCSDFFYKGRKLINGSDLLMNRRKFKFFYVSSSEFEFAFIFLKTLLKKKEFLGCIKRLNFLWNQNPKRVQSKIFELVEEEFDEFSQIPLKSEADLHKWRKKILKRSIGVKFWISEKKRLINRINKPIGLYIVFLGSDGVGKTTLIDNLKSKLLFGFSRFYQFHFRPMIIFPKNNTNQVTKPHEASPRSSISSFIKIWIYFFDHIIGYWIKIFPLRVRWNCIFFDRYFDDLSIDSRRYRLSKGLFLIDWLKRFIPAPDLFFVLHSTPSVILKRKAELTYDELDRQRNLLLKVREKDENVVKVEADMDGENVAKIVESTIVKYLIARTKKRINYFTT